MLLLTLAAAQAVTFSTPCAFPLTTNLFPHALISTTEDADQIAAAALATVEPKLQRQILAAIGVDTLAEAAERIDHSEDELVYVDTLVSKLSPFQYYTKVTYYPGGNEYGAVFVESKAQPAVRIGDGDLLDCTLRVPSAAREFRGVPYIDGSQAWHARFKGFEELRTVSAFGGHIGDGTLTWHLAAGQTLPDLRGIRMKQLAAARRAIINFSPAYGEAIVGGNYFEDELTFWTVQRMVDPSNGRTYDVVHFNELDDGSHTVVFPVNSAKVSYVYYEN